MRGEKSHLVSSIVGAEVANDHNQIPYHSLHLLVLTLGQLRTAIVEQDCHHVKELERQTLLAENFLQRKTGESRSGIPFEDAPRELRPQKSSNKHCATMPRPTKLVMKN